MIAGVLVYAALLGALLGGAAWAGERALERARGPAAGGRRWLWAAALAGTLLGPAWTLAVAARAVRAAAAPPPAADVRRLDIDDRVAAAAAERDQTPAPPTAWARRWIGAGPRMLPVPTAWGALDGPLLVLWAGASLVLLGRHGASALRVRRLVRGWPAGDLGPVAGPSGAGAPRRVHLARDVGPAVVGALRPRVVVPRWALTDPRLPLMLAHERSHVAARDPLLRAAATVAAALVPWSPAAWWQLARLRDAVELDCDARVLRASGAAPHATRVAARAYGALLLDVAARAAGRDGTQSPRAPALLALAAPPSLLRRRIDAMTLPGSPRPRRPLLVGAASAGALVALGCAMPRPVAAPPAVQLQLTATPAAAAGVALAPAPIAVRADTRPDGRRTTPDARQAAPTRSWRPDDQPRPTLILPVPVAIAQDTTPSAVQRDTGPARPTIVTDGIVVLPNTAAARRHFDSVGTMMLRMRLARGDTTVPRDSVHKWRAHMRAAIRDSGRVLEVRHFDDAGRQVGPTAVQPGPNAAGAPHALDSALIVINRREIGRGALARGEIGMATTLPADSVVSITVLKGHRAVQAYGERGRQGVVEIVTRGAPATP